MIALCYISFQLAKTKGIWATKCRQRLDAEAQVEHVMFTMSEMKQIVTAHVTDLLADLVKLAVQQALRNHQPQLNESTVPAVQSKGFDSTSRYSC